MEENAKKKIEAKKRIDRHIREGKENRLEPDRYIDQANQRTLERLSLILSEWPMPHLQ